MKFPKNNFKFFRNQFSLTQDQLAQKLSVDITSVAYYESGRANPSIKILKKMAEIYGLSLDYLILNEKCRYPRNIKFLELAKSIDRAKYSDEKRNIEGVIKNLLNDKSTLESEACIDSTDIELTVSFHENLKIIRISRNLSQSDLAKTLEVSRSLLSQYELSSYPPLVRIAQLSEILGISIHALATGNKLVFDFQDRDFGQTLLLADQHLSFEEHKMLIHLMEAILKK